MYMRNLKHIKIYEDLIDSLYKDLSILGLTNGRVIIVIDQVLSSRRNMGLVRSVEIQFPSLSSYEGDISYKDIAHALFESEYKIEPLKYGSEYGNGNKETVAERVEYKLLWSGLSKLRAGNDYEKNIKDFFKSFSLSFATKTVIKLLIDGNEVLSVDNEK